MQPIYIEISDEITTVIERIRESGQTNVALIVPKGAILLQSIVNLKLIKKTYTDLGLNVVLITTDKIGKNLARQVGIQSYSKFDPNGPLEEDVETEVEDPNVVGGVKIHKYYDENEVPEDSEAEVIAPIIPRELVEEKPAIKVRKIDSDDAPAKPIIKEKVIEVVKTKNITVDGLKESTQPTLADTPLETVAEAIEAVPSLEIAMSENVASISAEEVAHNTTKAIEKLNQKKKEKNDHVKKNRSFFFAYLIILIIIVGAGGCYAYLPKTQVSITLPSESWSKDLTITAAAAFDQNDPLQMLAEVKTIELTDELTFNATGVKNVGEKATGTATISYIQDSNPQAIPAGTRLKANNLYFITNQDVTVPGAKVVNAVPVAGTTSVSVTAESAGDASNLNKVPATVTSIQNLYAQIDQTTGGSSKEVKIVSQTDIANAKVALTKQVQDKVIAQLNTEITEDKYFFKSADDTLTLTDFATTVAAEAEAENGKATAKASIKRIYSDKSALIAKVREASNKDVAANTEQIIKEINPQEITVNKEQSSITIPTSLKGVTIPLISADQLRKKIPTKKLGTVEQIVKDISPTAQVTVKKTPSWWPINSAPVSARYLDIKITNE